METALSTILSPIILFFLLGLVSALLRSQMTVPEAFAKGLAIYLMMAIGLKGGVEMSKNPLTDAAAAAAHYGSISIVTFVAATEAIKISGIGSSGHLVALAALMETPAIISALLLARKSNMAKQPIAGSEAGELMREVLLNASVVVLIGALLIGWVVGEAEFAKVSPFFVTPFQGVLCLFLLDMGLAAGRGLRNGWRQLDFMTVLFGLYMPLVSATLAASICYLIGMPAGDAALFITLSASASYIAVPAAMRLALPEAKPSIYLTLSLGITFPFNVTLGIPLYMAMAQFIAS